MGCTFWVVFFLFVLSHVLLYFCIDTICSSLPVQRTCHRLFLLFQLVAAFRFIIEHRLIHSLQDVVLVEHQRVWPGSDPSEHSGVSNVSVASSNVDDTAYQNPRWMPLDIPPACSHCGALTNRYSLYCVFDGHNGVHAARHAGDAILSAVESRLPLGCPPPPEHHAYKTFCDGIQMALVESIVELNGLFAKRGILAGCTATVVLQVGWLLTCVNLGDSRAILDTGAETIKLTVDHRVASHKAERTRCEAMGAVVAPVAMWGSGPADDYSSGVGPLRIWPGGLCLSRAVGDFDVGDTVLPFPYLTQVLLPPTGGRLMVGSDGIWDAYDKMPRASGMSRNWSTDSTPTRMIQAIVRAYGGLKDDTSLIVVDITPGGIPFPQVVSGLKKRGPVSGAASQNSSTGSETGSIKTSGGFCGCFGGGSPTVGSPPMTSHMPQAPTGPGSKDPSVSVKSGTSYYSNGSVRGGSKPKADILIAVDIAGAMNLMSAPELMIPDWYTEDVGEALHQSAVLAADAWKTARGERYARPPATPMIPEVKKPKRKGRRVAFSESSVRAKEEGAEREGRSSIPRSASTAFSEATAADGEDFASKFGHYQGSGLMRPDFSVRAGRVYNSEASVRAGREALRDHKDPSVRLRGSDFEGSLHLKTKDIIEENSEYVEKEEPKPQSNATGLAPVRVVKRGGGPRSQPPNISGSR